MFSNARVGLDIIVVMKTICNLFIYKDSLVPAVLYFTSYYLHVQGLSKTLELWQYNYTLQRTKVCYVELHQTEHICFSLSFVLQESSRNSSRHNSPFKSCYQFLPNVLGQSRQFMTLPLMDFCFVLFQNIFLQHQDKAYQAIISLIIFITSLKRSTMLSALLLCGLIAI